MPRLTFLETMNRAFATSAGWAELARASHKAKQLLLLASTSALLLLAGCGAKDVPCPTKGWVSDRCAPYGEFRYGDKLLRIPNTEPNKFKWRGGLTYNQELDVLSSPNLAFYWRSGKAAGRESGDWPVWGDDLILFSLTWWEKEPYRQDVLRGLWRGLIAVETQVNLPFEPPPGLRMHLDDDGTPDFSARDTISFLDPDATTLIWCPSIESLTSKWSTGKTMCTGRFYLQPGLEVRFSIPTASLKDWPAAKDSLSNLIKSWETTNADQPATR